MTTKKDQEDLKKKAPTPIIDGDTRPDQQGIDETARKPNIATIKDKEKTTSGRVDRDTQDDFRDAK